MRRFDFDVEAAVRLYGAASVRSTWLRRSATSARGGGVSFNYLRDNALLSWMHMRLLFGFLLRLPLLLARSLKLTLHSARNVRTSRDSCRSHPNAAGRRTCGAVSPELLAHFDDAMIASFDLYEEYVSRLR